MESSVGVGRWAISSLSILPLSMERGKDGEVSMRLKDAQQIIREVDGKSLWWLKEWGLSTVRKAIRTVEDRVSATDEDLCIVERIKARIWRG